MPKHVSRTTAGFAVLAMGIAAGVLGCGESQSPTVPTALAGRAAVESPSPPAPAPAAVAQASNPFGAQLAAVRAATARFQDVSTAYAAGYTTENEPCVSSPAGAMGIHAPNLGLILDQALDPLRPEVLLYMPGPNGRLRLIGVEYFQAVLLRRKGTDDEPAPRLDPTPWDPDEYEVVGPQPQLFGQHFHLAPPPVPHVPWHWALHVWIWALNPSGMFADWNPSLSCG